MFGNLTMRIGIHILSDTYGHDMFRTVVGVICGDKKNKKKQRIIIS